VTRKLLLEVRSALSKPVTIERELVSESREHSWAWSGDNIVMRLVGRAVYSIGSMMRDFPELEPSSVC
jgi:hypothetical protein